MLSLESHMRQYKMISNAKKFLGPTQLTDAVRVMETSYLRIHLSAQIVTNLVIYAVPVRIAFANVVSVPRALVPVIYSISLITTASLFPVKFKSTWPHTEVPSLPASRKRPSLPHKVAPTPGLQTHPPPSQPM